MTRNEVALAALRAIARRQEEHPSDVEMAHSDADDVLLDLIADDEIRDAYARIKKWYA